MKNILVVLGGLLLPLCANANRIAILDEGFNQTLTIPVL